MSIIIRLSFVELILPLYNSNVFSYEDNCTNVIQLNECFWKRIKASHRHVKQNYFQQRFWRKNANQEEMFTF